VSPIAMPTAALLAACVAFSGRMVPHASMRAGPIRAVASWYDTGQRLTPEAGASSEAEPTLEGGFSPMLDYAGRPLEESLTPEQVAAYGGPAVRKLSYPSAKEEEASLRAQTAELAASIEESADLISRLLLVSIEQRNQVAELQAALALVEVEVAKAEAAQPVAEVEVSPAASAASATGSAPDGKIVAVGGLVAAALAYWYTTGVGVVDGASTAAADAGVNAVLT